MYSVMAAMVSWAMDWMPRVPHHSNRAGQNVRLVALALYAASTECRDDRSPRTVDLALPRPLPSNCARNVSTACRTLTVALGSSQVPRASTSRTMAWAASQLVVSKSRRYITPRKVPSQWQGHWQLRNDRGRLA